MKTPQTSSGFPQANILLVDDRYENLLSLKGILEAPDFNLITAQSGNEALTKTLETSFACILLDIEMPRLSGLEVAEILRKDPVMQSVPIILMSAYRREEFDVFKGYEFGAVDYLVKPMEPAMVRSKVRVFADLFRKQQTILELNAALQAANEDLRQLTKVAAHDLKEPARVMGTYCEYAARMLKAKSFESAEEKLNIATHNAYRMCSLIDDLVSFLNVRDNSCERQVVQLDSLIEEIIGEYSAAIDQVSAQVTAEDLPSVYANRSELKLVLSNLLNNSLKFRGSRPVEIVFSAQRINDQVVVAVTDTSEGIESRYHNTIFDLFHQLNRNPNSGGGNGVGLALCRQIIEKHGGRIWVESSVGKGSTFFFSVPYYEITDSV